jgi:hypothetical protein
LTTTSTGGADLQALMAIADRYARRLVADTPAPVAVLLVERAGELDVVMLDGEGPDVIPQVRRLLGQSGATSAALLIEPTSLQRGSGGAAFWIFGESSDGTTARRRYRFRASFRTRRLTPLADGEDPEVEAVLCPLFPVHQSAGDVDGGAADGRPGATTATAPDTTATAGHVVAA